MSEMHLRQSGFKYSACAAFTKNKERMQNIKLHYLNTIQCLLLFTNKFTCCEITQLSF